jgi:Phospholipase_D-nuclease N-terminal
MLDWDFSNLGFGGVAHLLAVIWALFHVFQANREPMSKAIWTTFIVLLPGFGFFCWLFFGPRAVKQLN